MPLISTLPHQGKISGMTIAQTLWCRCKKDKPTSKETYKPAGFPVDIVAKLKPTYNDLSKDDLLDNESFNATIWDRFPKSTYVSHTPLKLQHSEKVCHFSIGEYKFVPVYYKLLHCKRENKRRLLLSSYRNKPSMKK